MNKMKYKGIYFKNESTIIPEVMANLYLSRRFEWFEIESKDAVPAIVK